MTADITVTGVVQGVGFRPFVFRLAGECGISGSVRNSGGIVRIKASGTEEQIRSFAVQLEKKAPSGAVISDIKTEPAKDEIFSGFIIVDSDEEKEKEFASFPPDICTCDTCIAEMKNPANRRSDYPFISCAACGPRYSILEQFPYDRCNTTMKDFDMCGKCALEYNDGANRYARRHYAQTVSCGDCGPQAILRMKNFELKGKGAVIKAADMLQSGAILAVKGIGGYQFVCTPESAYAVMRLRDIKGREKKPFAVMFPSIESMKEYAVLTQDEKKLLSSSARPIVLVKTGNKKFERYVSGESRYLGAFLPNTGLHQILTESCGPLIVTSGNISDEPLSFRDEDFFRHEYDGVEGILYNKRRILTPLDDSVARVECGKVQLLRRARGYVPIPIDCEYEAKKPAFAAGADMKGAFAISRGHRIIMSQYFGDMGSYSVLTNYREALKRMEGLYDFYPLIVAADKHPLYNSTIFASEYARKVNAMFVSVQHHHAHVASVMAEYSLNHCIGVAFDGTGYGNDGTVWGSEFLSCRGAKYERAAHLKAYTLLGGDASAKDAERTARCILHEAGEKDCDELLKAAMDQGINTYLTTSMGRLFDAVAAVLGIRMYNTYEGECAIALENAASAASVPAELPVTDNVHEIISEVLEMKRRGVDVREIARGFHECIAAFTVEKCMAIRDNTAERTVVLSGGVFANRLLLNQTVSALEQKDFAVYINSRLPMNDGGIAAGQAYLLNL